MTSRSEERAHLIGGIARAASVRALNASPALQRTDSASSERDQTLARLEGGSTIPSPSLSRQGSLNAAPRLSAITRRQLEKQQQKQQAQNESPASPDFSIFTPSVMPRPKQQVEEDVQEVIQHSPTASEATASDFRAYRHTMERDRDSAYARLRDEDQFEYAELLRTAPIRSNKTPIVHDRFPSPSAEYRFPSPEPDERFKTRSKSPTTTARQIKLDNAAVDMRRIMSEGDSRSSRLHTNQSHSRRQSTDTAALDPATRKVHRPSQMQSEHGNRSQQKARLSPHQTASPALLQQSRTFHGHRATNSNGTPRFSTEVTSVELDNSDFEDDHTFESEARPLPRSKPSEGVVERLSQLLVQNGMDDSTTVDRSRFDDPPRRLVMHTPALQVVNAHTVKDRYLFLFTDLLVIAKPIIKEDPVSGLIIPPSLDSNFLVKSVVELDKLRLTAQREDDVPNAAEDATEKKKKTLLAHFVDRFANNPKKAIETLVTKGGLADEPPVIANLLFRTPELNRSQVGSFLCRKENKHVLKAYVDRFRFAHVRVEDALRIFLATLRLPNDPNAAEYLLSTFASIYALANPDLGLDVGVCGKLVIAIMELNDYLHSGMNDESGSLFGFPNPAITVDDFLSAFRTKDAGLQTSDDALSRIYLSIRKERLQQAADNSIIAVTPEIPIVLSPARLPSRITYRQASDVITITLPKPDPRFQIRLVGGHLECEPNLLSFSRQNAQSFTIGGHVLGPQTLLFLKMGPTCTHYTGIPINKTLSVERAFMKHTFQVAFVNHNSVKRKYMFSMSDDDSRSLWVHELSKGSQRHASLRAKSRDRTTDIADSVSLQVLRDSLLAPEDASSNLPQSARPNSGGRLTANGAGKHVRSNSFSKVYEHTVGKAEKDIGAANAKALLNDRRPSHVRPNQASNTRDDVSVELAQSKIGHDLVTTVCQNSHIPAVLSLMNGLVSGATHPLAMNGSTSRHSLGSSVAAAVNV